MELSRLSQSTVLSDALVDVAATRERTRQGRVARIAFVLALAAGWAWWRVLTDQPVWPGLPSFPIAGEYMFGIVLVCILGVAVLAPLRAILRLIRGDREGFETIAGSADIDAEIDEAVHAVEGRG